MHDAGILLWSGFERNFNSDNALGLKQRYADYARYAILPRMPQVPEREPLI
jgi:hypothetical protein